MGSYHEYESVNNKSNLDAKILELSDLEYTRQIWRESKRTSIYEKI